MRENKKYRVIVGVEIILLCMIVGVIGTNAASVTPPSNQVNYSKNGQATVQSAINDLYAKVSYGDAASNEIVSGKTALVGGKQVVGTYTCPSLASQTLGDATPEDIDQGKIAWVNGNRIVGSYRPTSLSTSSGDLIPVNTLAYDVKLGDYISYVPLREKYMLVGREGFDFESFSPSLMTMWRVIRKNANGTVDIVSDRSVDRVSFGKGIANAYTEGYSVFILTLNRIAAAYEHPYYTVGSRHMGCIRKRGETALGESAPDEDYKTDIELVENALGTLEYGKGSPYWIASRSEYPNVRWFSAYGEIRSDISLMSTRRALIRPIVVLRSDLKITGGDGTESSPYTLGI